MNEVWKFKICMSGESEILMPKGAEIVDVAVQGDYICMWAIVDNEVAQEKHTFIVRGTGWEYSKASLYIGTVHVPPFVWHVFELKS